MRTTPACVETWKSAALRRPDDQLGRPATDVDHQRWRLIVRVAFARRPEEREFRLLVPAQHMGLEVVAVADGGGELGAVRRVAHGAGEDGDALVESGRLHPRVVVVEGVVDPLHGVLAQPAVGVDAGPQASDLRSPLELVADVPALDVGDQEPRRVRPDIDDGDAHHTT